MLGLKGLDPIIENVSRARRGVFTAFPCLSRVLKKVLVSNGEQYVRFSK